MLVLSIFFTIFTTTSSGKIQTNWGKIYDVRFNKFDPNNLVTIPSSGDVSDYFNGTTLSPNNGFFDYLINQISTNSSTTAFTIVFPLRDYKISKSLKLDLLQCANHPGFTLNIVGYNDLPTGEITDVNFNENLIPKTEITMNATNDPTLSNFITNNTLISDFPTISKDHSMGLSGSDLQHLFLVFNPSATSLKNSFNMMGMRIYDEHNPEFTLTYNSVTQNYDVTHPYYDAIFGYAGLMALNFKRFDVDNMVLENIYGDGIFLQNGNFVATNNTTRNNSNGGNVERNVLLNCWGLNPTEDSYPGCNAQNSACAQDNYGQPIIINGLKDIMVKNNYVVNNLNQTKQFGMAGITSQGNENFTIESNLVSGYDRDLHIEVSYGSNYVKNNRCLASVMSLIISNSSIFTSNSVPYILPIPHSPHFVTNNYFSTEGIPDANPTNKSLLANIYYSYEAQTLISNNLANGPNINSIFANNIVKFNHKDLNFLYAANSNYFTQSNISSGSARELLKFNVNNVTVDCNQFIIESLPTGQLITSSLYGINCNQGSWESFKGNQFMGHFYNPISSTSQPPPSVACFGNVKAPGNYSEVHAPFYTGFFNNSNQVANCNCHLTWGATSSPYNCSNPSDNSIFLSTYLNAQLTSGNTVNYSCSGVTGTNTSGIFTGLPTGTYTVTATEVGNPICSIQKVMTIVPGNFSFGYAQSVSACSSATIVQFYGGNLPITYLLNDGINPTSTNTTGLFDGNVNTTYTITATDSKGCSTYTVFNNPFCYNAEYCNSTQPKDEISNGYSSSLLNGNVSNHSYYIKGVFTINSNAPVSFTGCNFYFAPGASIKVLAGKTLTLDNCTLKAACDQYWQGIIAENATSSITINNCTLEDMLNGVQAKNNATLIATGSTFRNNFIHSLSFENISNLNYNGSVTNNAFICDANFLINPAMPNVHKSLNAIYANNCVKLNIGELNTASSGNRFENLYNGLALYQTALPYTEGIAKYGVYNNSFKHIKEDTYNADPFEEVQKVTNCYTNTNGSAIYSVCNGTNTLQSLLDVQNINYADANHQFEQCDKGVLTYSTNLKTKNLMMNSTLFGIMNTDANGKNYDLQHNKLNDNIVGIQINGQSHEAKVSHNVISTRPGILAGYNLEYLWPKGIEVNNVLLNNNLCELNTNQITMHSKAGLGISLNNAGVNTVVSNSSINMGDATNNSTIGYMGSNRLNGIAVSNGVGVNLTKNNIVASVNSTTTERADMAGIYINKTPDMTLHCNTTSRSRFGMLTVDGCATDVDKVAGNNLDRNVLGMVFRNLVDPGTLGDIGSANLDNNNQFITDANSASKLFRFCYAGVDWGKIFTNSLSTADSRSFDGLYQNDPHNCDYEIWNLNSGHTTFDCPIIQWFPFHLESGQIFNFEEAMLIASDTKEYDEYYEVARWMDRKNLYTQLKEDEGMRSSDPILLSFYNDMNIDPASLVDLADANLYQLLNSYGTQNAQTIENYLNSAETQNGLINNTTLQEENEQQINDIFLKILRDGQNSLNLTETATIETLAQQCPYVGGSAVYKARTLYSHYAPTTQWDDLAVCNNAGVYKNAGSNDSTYQSENELLSHISSNEISIFPNPASTQLKIKYNSTSDTRLQLFTMLGVLVQEIDLTKKATSYVVKLNNLPSGIYLYKHVQNETILKTGKLTISN